MNHGDDLGVCFHELAIPLSQLAELPAAERSEQPPQEHQDHGSPAQTGPQRELTSGGRYQGEVGSQRTLSRESTWYRNSSS